MSNRQRPETNVEQAAEAIATILGSPPSDVTALHGGEWSAAFRFQSTGRSLVARFAFQRDDFDRDLIASAWSRPGLVVPQITHVRPHHDHFVAISEFSEGFAFDELPRDELLQALPSLLTALETLRSLDPPGAGYGSWAVGGDAQFDSWEEHLLDIGNDRPTNRTSGWRAKLETVERGPELFAAGYSALQELAGTFTGPRHIVHGDVLAGNVLVAHGEITAVLDWGCSQYGDPLLDPAILAFWEPWHPDDLGLNDLLRKYYCDETDFEDRFKCCQIHIALDAMAYNAWTERWGNVVECGERVVQLAS